MLSVKINIKNNRGPKHHIKRIANKRESVQTIQQINEWDYFITYLENNFTINSLLEVGTAWGGALYGFAQISSPKATIITIDDNSKDCNFSTVKEKENHIKGYIKDQQKIHFIHSDSHTKECESQVKNILGNNKVDFLFIDGDHSYEGVKSDYNMYSKYVKESGVIGFHDVAGFQEQESVKRFWDEIKNDFNYMEFIWCTQKMGIGVIHNTKNFDSMDCIDVFHTKNRKPI